MTKRWGRSQRPMRMFSKAVDTGLLLTVGDSRVTLSMVVDGDLPQRVEVSTTWATSRRAGGTFPFVQGCRGDPGSRGYAEGEDAAASSPSDTAPCARNSASF